MQNALDLRAKGRASDKQTRMKIGVHSKPFRTNDNGQIDVRATQGKRRVPVCCTAWMGEWNIVQRDGITQWWRDQTGRCLWCSVGRGGSDVRSIDNIDHVVRNSSGKSAKHNFGMCFIFQVSDTSSSIESQTQRGPAHLRRHVESNAMCVDLQARSATRQSTNCHRKRCSGIWRA